MGGGWLPVFYLDNLTTLYSIRLSGDRWGGGHIWRHSNDVEGHENKVKVITVGCHKKSGFTTINFPARSLSENSPNLGVMPQGSKPSCLRKQTVVLICRQFVSMPHLLRPEYA